MNDNDPKPIPYWLTDPEAAAPCPCGYPPGEENLIMTKGETGLATWYHEGCIPDFFEKEDE